jgi:putative hemolysin
VDELEDLLGPAPLPVGDYQTLAGLVITQLGRLPTANDRFESGGHRYEVIEMDGKRVGSVRVTRLSEGGGR